MRLDWRLRLLLLADKNVDEASVSVEQVRADHTLMMARLERYVMGPAPTMHEERVVSVPFGAGATGEALFLRPTAEPNLPVVVFVHGGGWTVGKSSQYSRLLRLLAATAKCAVLAVDYRLAPESPAPGPLEDVLAAVAFIRSKDSGLPVNRDRVALMGDSSGGNLATSAALQLSAEGVALSHLVLLYPVLDCDFDTASYTSNVFGFGLTRKRMQWYWRQYVPAEGDRVNPRYSPLRAPSLKLLPRTSLVVAEYDVLHSEGLAFAERLEEEGVDVTLDDVPGVIHGFLLMQRLLPQARTSFARLCRQLELSFAARPDRARSQPLTFDPTDSAK
jgi:acetyl esterase